MIARVKINLPFNILMLNDELILLHTTYEFDYSILFHPPMRDELLKTGIEEYKKTELKDCGNSTRNSPGRWGKW
jgi:hypothetical protein